ncbi:MAG: DMT family transporter [Deltaproteobacteria bacterium]|nr:DMT family transporter [Deltaproteobacteria bacterium]MCB9789302.1 DMT family transporter [Deltaproteobacteria bacterium]
MTGPAFLLFAATLLWGFWGFANKRAVMLAHPLHVQWAYALPFALSIPVFWWLARRAAPGVIPSAEGVAWAAGAGASTIAGLLCLLFALRVTSASTAIAVTSAYPLVAMLFLAVTGAEPLTPRRLVGCAIVVAGLVVLQWQPAAAPSATAAAMR